MKLFFGLLLALVLSLATGQSALAQSAGPAASASASAPAAVAPSWQRFARLKGRITAAQLGLVINSADPYSVAVGEYYAARRNIPEANILRVTLPLRATLEPAEFEALQAQIKAELGPEVQALALAWTQPYAVACNSITSALALGFQPEICKNSCAPSQPSPYFNYFGATPFTDLGLRPSMLLAARSVDSGKALIDRGIASDHSLPGFVPANAYFVSTSDTARNVRASLFPPASRLPGVNVQLLAQQNLPSLTRTLIYQTGLVSVPGLDQVEWLPGALADHLTSYGGQLERRLEKGNVQMSALDWLEAGATASYGTVSEPCNHRQKFPHPQFLLLAYVQGVSALEAYWHSVLWPGQGVFIGEPLAAPFSRAF